MTRPHKTRPRPPYAWEAVVHYGNAQVTPKNWVAVLLRKRGATAPPGQPVYGFESAEEVRPVLSEFQRVLGTLVGKSLAAAENSMILDLINERARGTLKGWTWDRGTGRVFPQIRTQTESFEESLYAQLATAMTVEAFTSIKQCGTCGRFFYEPRRRVARFCSVACREAAAKERVARYREEHKDQYRDYQRRLMARRRQEGTA